MWFLWAIRRKGRKEWWKRLSRPRRCVFASVAIPPALVVAEAAEVIRAAGRPMTRREIHKALSDQGIVVNGTDPIKALGTMLWRSGEDVLEQIDGWGYGLKGVHYELNGTPPIKKRTLTINFKPIHAK